MKKLRRLFIHLLIFGIIPLVFHVFFFFHNRQPVIPSLFLGGKCCQFVTRVSEQYSKNRCMVNMTLAAVKVSFEERCHILDVESEINLFSSGKYFMISRSLGPKIFHL